MRSLHLLLVLSLVGGLAGCDQDGDGFGQDDCDDADPAVFPGAEETCNGLDDDCDDFVDEGQVFSPYHADEDGDLFGDPASPERSECAPADGIANNADDCDDTESSVHPGASEVCDGMDNDCDGGIDEDLRQQEYRRDQDGDGYGDQVGEPQVYCAPIEGLVDVGGDCDDEDPDRHPGAEEVCDDVDQDCNGGIDDGLPFETWYPDLDNDGFGDENADPFVACDVPPDAALDENSDCDDTRPEVRPDQDDPCLDCDPSNDGGCD